MFSRVCCSRIKVSGFTLKECRFKLYGGKKIFTMRVSKHWHRFSREMTDVSSLGTSQEKLDRAVSRLFQLNLPLLIAGGLYKMSFSGTFHAKLFYDSKHKPMKSTQCGTQTQNGILSPLNCQQQFVFIYFLQVF